MIDGTKIHISTLDLDMASVISQNSRENLYAFLRRMDLETEEHWDKEVLAMYLKDTILENPEYILYIYNSDSIDFLIQLWESKSMEIEQREYAVIGQLKLLGFVDFRFAERPDGTGHGIYVVKEAKEAFYFYLKSKSAKMMMDRYYTWEVIVRGLLAYYGIISFQRLYYLFCRLIKSPVDDGEFHRFLSVRIDLFQFGGFALEKTANVEYYQNYEIRNPENVLEIRQEHDSMNYYLPDYEEVIYTAENNGIGNWDGIRALAEIFLQLLDIEYYKTVIAIKSCILMVQNDEKPKEIEEHLYYSYPECKPFRDKIRTAIYSLYYSVPVYSLKGWCRREWKNIQRTKPSFTVVKGGRTKPKEEGR